MGDQSRYNMSDKITGDKSMNQFFFEAYLSYTNFQRLALDSDKVFFFD